MIPDRSSLSGPVCLSRIQRATLGCSDRKASGGGQECRMGKEQFDFGGRSRLRSVRRRTVCSSEAPPLPDAPSGQEHDGHVYIVFEDSLYGRR